MIRATIGRAADVSRFIAAGMLALCAVRFAGSGVVYAIDHTVPNAQSARAPSPPAPSGSLSSRPEPPAPPKPVKPAVKKGTSLRLSLLATVGPDRSDVLLDGVNVGQTPFVGDVTCKAGEKIEISIVPPKGMPKRYERVCEPGATLRIEH